ncbi:hypothetical protein POJ06DRAFT_257707 [Lipomyces tetrasporus]|uniref:Uncharacterized protein n=1 Tax=Lipomyces tetrasporus TaxID=54092 RepID=A0AAD7QNV5_9ASCO|nr:uncharacterized protein POJ06DRAFT_257707 [Lipomyces tetrasporus]KAJ8098686.1 hypothetical protein POJ06DRAFT_257707 [Lipomyces tetrasporus]
MYLEMQITKADGKAVSPWFEETAVIVAAQPGVPQCRLSGRTMRNFLYFATAPGNSTLYVAEKKNGIISQLPVIYTIFLGLACAIYGVNAKMFS